MRERRRLSRTWSGRPELNAREPTHRAKLKFTMHGYGRTYDGSLVNHAFPRGDEAHLVRRTLNSDNVLLQFFHVVDTCGRPEKVEGLAIELKQFFGAIHGRDPAEGGFVLGFFGHLGPSV